MYPFCKRDIIFLSLLFIQGAKTALLCIRDPPTPSPTSEPICDDDDNAGGGCDPHFHMWSGKHFSYHGECDLVLMSSSDFVFGVGLDIHIRTEIKEHFSFIKAVALKLGNHKFEMDAHQKYFYDGKPHDVPPPTFNGHPIMRMKNATWCSPHCSKAIIYQIDLGMNGNVELANWNGFLHIEIHGNNFKEATGLLGRLGQRGNFGRNGTKIEDLHSYGLDWQIRDTDPVLFHDLRYPIYPNPCVLPKTTFQRRIVKPEITSMAEQVCSHLSDPLFEMCKFDVEATGDKMMARAPMYG